MLDWGPQILAFLVTDSPWQEPGPLVHPWSAEEDPGLHLMLRILSLKSTACKWLLGHHPPAMGPYSPYSLLEEGL